MLGDGTNFTHWDEVALAWQFVDSILRVWENEKADFPNYDSGSMGPDEAEQLLEQDGFHWRSEEHTSELQSRGHLVCRLLLEKKKNTNPTTNSLTNITNEL